MEILDNYSYLLRFRIKKYILSPYQKRWDKIKNICESGSNKRDVCCLNCGHVQQEYLGVTENTEDVVKQWKPHFKLESTKSFIYLDVDEGGMYNPMRPGCGLLFRNNKHISCDTDSDIVIEIVNLPKDSEKWTHPELDDLRNAFVQMMKIKIGITIDSCIEMNVINTNNDINYDSSSSSDNDEEFESSICL